MMQAINTIILFYMLIGLCLFITCFIFIDTLDHLLKNSTSDRYLGPNLGRVNLDEMSLPQLAFYLLSAFTLFWPIILYAIYDINRKG
jgi:hypothetical protein